MSGEGRSASGAGQPGVFSPGTVVGRRYRLDTVIGEGGMGVVHRATDQIMRRTVAIKQVRLPAGAGMAVAQARERVLREARAAGRVHHPGAVGVLDVIDDGELPWIVMELVEGEALSALTERDGGLPVERVAQIGISLAYALDAAHRLGVIHRDVKPSNVIVTPDGQARLTDFGIAVSQGDPRLTRTGEVIGSPAYLSPERAQGDAGGPACDVWGLGGTLYAAVEGEPPFGGGTPVDILTSVVEGLIRPPRHAGPLWPVLRTMLAQREADRPSLTVVRSRLRDFSGETASRTAGTQPRTPRPAAAGTAPARPAPASTPRPAPSRPVTPSPAPSASVPPAPVPPAPVPVPPRTPAASTRPPGPPAPSRPAEAAATPPPPAEAIPAPPLPTAVAAAGSTDVMAATAGPAAGAAVSTEAGPTRVLEDVPDVSGDAESDATATALMAAAVPEADTTDSPGPASPADPASPAEAEALADVTVLSGGPATSPPVTPPAAVPVSSSVPAEPVGSTSTARPAQPAAVATGRNADTGTVAMAGSAPGTTVVERASTPAPFLGSARSEDAPAGQAGAGELAPDHPADPDATSKLNGAQRSHRSTPRPPARPDPAPRSARSHAERRAVIVLVAIIVVLAVALLLVRLSSSDDDKPAVQSTATVPASAVVDGASLGAEPALATGSTPMVAPPGWVSYVDPSGWSVAYPALWQRQVGTGGPGMVDFVDPGTGTFLRVGSLTAAPRSVLDDWLKSFEAAFRGDAQHYPGYQRVRLAPADGNNGTSEADLEFTYRTDRGKVHVLDRGASRGGHGYLLYWQTGEERWTVDQSLRQQMFASFRPAP